MIVDVGVTVGCFVVMFVVTFNGIYIFLSVVIDSGLDACDSVGPYVSTYMDTSVYVRVSVSVTKPLQCDVRQVSEEMVFPSRSQICIISC